MAEKFTFFWRGPFSQWFKSPFIVDGILYTCAEQFMMASKARLFDDQVTLDKIMNTTHPREHQTLGREVKNFVKGIWNKVAKPIVYRGNIAKYTQNPILCEKLVATVGTTLVEVSPIDKIWGVGLGEDDPDITNRLKWQGENWLGETLTKVRDDIMKGHVGQCLFCTFGQNDKDSCVNRKNISTLASKGCLIDVKGCYDFQDVLK